MQRTWWPDAGTIIVTGPYWMVTIPHPETVVIQRESSAIQCAYNLDPGVHWNATGERSVSNQWVSSISPTCFQWSSTVFPSCKLPLDCNWGTIGESMSQCGSTVVCSVVSQYASGLPFFLQLCKSTLDNLWNFHWKIIRATFKCNSSIYVFMHL